MPYFKWVGINLIGDIKKGKNIAFSSAKLSTFLHNQGISLLSSKTIRLPLSAHHISAKIKADLFKQQAQLLHAGILLPNVLDILSQQFYNPFLCEILLHTANDIRNGISFNKALEKHSVFCDPIVKIMIHAGYEADKIIDAIEAIASYFYKQHLFNKHIRSILMMPLLTFLFLIAITCFIFVIIVPRFADMFASLQQELPLVTQYIISISEFMTSYSILYVTIGIGILCIFGYFFIKKNKNWWNTTIHKIPFIGSLFFHHQAHKALQALSLLVTNGVPLVIALQIVTESIDEPLKSYLTAVHYDVATGQSLNNALINYHSLFFPEMIPLIRMGEEAGTLVEALKSATSLYNDRLEESLQRFIFLLQPTVIILLGLLITTLIVAVYLPIMQLSYVL